MFVVASRLMHDVGFSPRKGERVLTEVRKITSASIEYGLRVPAVRWLMIESLFTGGVGIYGFYALQPYLLQLYGDRRAYVIAGLAAAIVAGAQILGGLAAPRIRRVFRRRTSALIATATLGVVVLGLMGILQNFWVVIGLVVIWSLIFAASMPIRQTYMNGMIPSRQRATILSFDSMMGSAGGVWAQPLLGRVADVWGYGPSYVVGAAISAIAVPALVLSRRQNAPADTVQTVAAENGSGEAKRREVGKEESGAHGQ
jgi:MFS family permease